jgi:hypothetical protein
MNRTALAAVWPPTAAVADRVGHKRVSPMQAIRAKCLDCCCGQFSEIRLCEAVNCPLWPFRAGSHPYTSASLKKGLQEATFEAGEAVAT